ncbi:MAG: glycosyltransferase [Thiobacillus sp.]|nr:glycosyltransferase [Thiobacillus sp.]
MSRLRRMPGACTGAGAGMPHITLIAIAHEGAGDVAAFCHGLEAQTYPAWDLVLCVDRVLAELSPPPIGEGRLRIVQASPGGAMAAMRQAVANARGEYVVELALSDRLPANALHDLARAIDKFPAADLLYGDVACMASDGAARLMLKPAWNPELFRGMDYVSGFLAIRRDPLVAQLERVVGAEDEWRTAVLFRLAEAGAECRHIPRVLVQRRDCAGNPAGNPDDARARMRMLEVELGGASGPFAEPGALAGTVRVRYPIPVPLPRVEIIIPTRNGGALLGKCVGSLLDRTRYDNFSVLIVDNRSDDADTLRFLENMAGKPDVRVLPFPRPFNYSAINNMAVAATDAEVVCLLNDDVEVISEDWLREMVSHAMRPEVGAVGAKLLYPDGTVQHAGIVVGMRRSAAHGHKGFPGDAPGYMGRLQVAQNCTAVTGACLVIRRDLYVRMGGLNERELAVAYNDVDFCLRLGAAGYRNVWTPHALLYHHESASRGRDITPEKRRRLKAEAAYMNRRWRMDRFEDPCHHPGLSLAREDFSLASWAQSCWRTRRVVAR